MTPERLGELTKWRRTHGLHSVLKPSFQLNPSASLESLVETAHFFAANLEPVEIPQLEINIIGKFIALAPTIPSRRIVEVVSQCVRAFNGYRLPLMIDLNVRYIRNKLTVNQSRMLKHWGYPFVMEEYQFFIPLTDRIEDDKDRNKKTKALAKLSNPTFAYPMSINALTVLGQNTRQEPMGLIERVPFGRQ